MKKENTWYEIRIDSLSSSRQTQREAIQELMDMKSGYLDKHNEENGNDMTPENRKYWKKMSEKAKIFKVVQSAVEIKI